jgi:recombination protein RecA
MSQTPEQAQFSNLLNLASKTFEKTHSGAVYRPSDIRLASFVPYGIPSGIAQLDLALGRTGLPAGKVVEIHGFEGSGKTTLALTIVAQIQRMGGAALWIDTENSFDPILAAARGVNTGTNLLVSYAGTIEAIYRQIEQMLAHIKVTGWERPFLFVVDSTAGVPTEQESVAELTGDARVGGEAKAIRRGVKRVWGPLGRQRIAAVFINHTVAANLTAGYGKKSQSAGGHAVKFAAALRIELKVKGQIAEGKDEEKVREGQKTLVTVEKWKGGPNRTPIFEVPLLDDFGFDQAGSLAAAFGALDSLPGKGWKQACEDPAFFQQEYKRFYTLACEKGVMIPWGVLMEDDGGEDAGQPDSTE